MEQEEMVSSEGKTVEEGVTVTGICTTGGQW